jgi:RNA polymerase sigma-70 factor, ECF subfamily
MSDATWATLRRLFVADYARFRIQLVRLTGSNDLANEAMQDTYVRLERGGEIKDHLESPRSYLFKMMLNSARGIARKDRLRERYIDLADTLDVTVADEKPGPAEIEEARSDMKAMAAILMQMPSRRREIFLLSWFEDMPHPDIAARYKLTVRMVQMELKRAREDIAQRFEKMNIVDFASALRKTLDD